MQFIKITKTNATLTATQFFELHPTVAFPCPISNIDLIPYGATLVEPEVIPPTQFEKDLSRYEKRAKVKDQLLAYMAADNMSRVREGVWTVQDLVSLLDDPAVVSANALMGTLSFELAAQQIESATIELLTPSIKAQWISQLQQHYYLEG